MSAFSEAISATMVAGLDPMNAMQKDYASAVITKVKADTVLIKKDAGMDVAKALSEAKASGADGQIVQFYSDLLNELTAL